MIQAQVKNHARRALTSSVGSKGRVLDVFHVRQTVPYTQGLALLKEKQEAKIVAHRESSQVPNDCIILLEHFPVFTLGRNADVENVLFDKSDGRYELHRVERGGEVTFHGPGQIVGYPVLDLRRHKQDLHWYMRQVEEVIIQVLGCHKIKGDRKEKYTGVWVENAKVAAIGLNASKWITSHGFALNVTTDLNYFSKIIPCGITEEGTSVTSLEKLVDGTDPKPILTRQRLQEVVVQEFMKAFKFDRCHVHEI